MGLYRITHGADGRALWEGRASSFKEALSAARIQGADLAGADLRGTDLGRSDLAGLDLQGADLSGAFLRGADLAGAGLCGARMRGADLRGACLRGADLREADLRAADFLGIDLAGADLRAARVVFRSFPVATLPLFPLGDLPDDLCLELILRDAWNSPGPESFCDWVQGGRCPLDAPGASVERRWMFNQRPEPLRRHLRECRDRGIDGPDVWRPRMSGAALILAVCRFKGWGVRGLLSEDGRPVGPLETAP